MTKSNGSQRSVAAALGYRLVGHRLELFGVRSDNAAETAEAADKAKSGNGSDSGAR